MRIAVLTDLLRPNGAGLMALSQATLLSRSGTDDVRLFAAAATDSIQRRQPVSVDAFLADDRPWDTVVSPSDHRHLRRGFRRWLDDGLAAFEPDVVLCHNIGRVLDQPDVADLSQATPTGFVLHDDWFLTDAHYTYATGSDLRRDMEPFRTKAPTAHAFDHLWDVQRRAGRLVGIAPSAWLHRRWRASYPHLPCLHLTNPVDEEVFALRDRAEARRTLGIDERAQVIGFVGAPHSARKGLARLAAAVGILAGQGRPVLLLVVGGSMSTCGTTALGYLRDGFLTDHLPGTPVLDSDLPAAAETVTVVVGGVPRSAMADLYGAMDVLVHPSIIDNLPTVPIEAGMVGTRCLATDVGGTAETIAEPDGLVPAATSTTAWAQRLATELDHRRTHDPSARTARRARQVERFSVAGHVARLVPTVRWIAGVT